jgi:hypothetical protein
LLPGGQFSDRLHRYTRNPHQHGEQATLRLYARCVAIDADEAAVLERRERAAIVVLADAVKDDVEPAL